MCWVLANGGHQGLLELWLAAPPRTPSFPGPSSLFQSPYLPKQHPQASPVWGSCGLTWSFLLENGCLWTWSVTLPTPPHPLYAGPLRPGAQCLRLFPRALQAVLGLEGGALRGVRGPLGASV